MNTRSRAWLITGGILALVVGFLALGSPILFSFLIVRLLAVFALSGGVIVAGLALLYCIPSGLHVITLMPIGPQVRFTSHG